MIMSICMCNDVIARDAGAHFAVTPGSHTRTAHHTAAAPNINTGPLKVMGRPQRIEMDKHSSYQLTTQWHLL